MAFLRRKADGDANYGDVYSLLQKSVRRGNEGHALYAAKVLYDHNTKTKTSKLAAVLRKRMVLILLEDICSIRGAVELACGEDSGRLEMNRWVVWACRQKKTHVASWAIRAAAKRLLDGDLSQYPKGGVKTLGLRKDCCEGKGDSDEIELAAMASLFASAGVIGESPKFDNFLTSVSNLTGFSRYQISKTVAIAGDLRLITACTVLCKSRKSTLDPTSKVSLPAIKNVKEAVSTIPVELKEYPDYVYDKHTMRGKSLRRGYPHFFEHGLVFSERFFPRPGQEPYETVAKGHYTVGKYAGAKVRNVLAAVRVVNVEPKHEEQKEKSTNLVDFESSKTRKRERDHENIGDKKSQDQALKRLKPESKSGDFREGNILPGCIPDKICESFHDDFKSLIQAQLLTGRSKSKTLFGKWVHSGDNCGNTFFIKGPLKKEQEAERQMLTERVKAVLGLPHTDMQTRRYSEGLFLISKCIVSIDHDRFEFRSTKIEQDVKVSVNAVPHYVDEIQTSALQKEILLALALRKIVGANDTCKRNFILKGENIFSVDDEAKFVQTQFMWSKALSKDKAKPFRAAVKAKFKQIQTVLSGWMSKLQVAVAAGELTLTKDQLLFMKKRIEELKTTPGSWAF